MNEIRIEDFIRNFEELFSEEPWYGAALLGSLEDISIEKWNKKPIHVSNSIAALVWHMIDWRYFIIEKIKENKAFDIKLNSEADWRKDIFVETQDDITKIIGELKKTQKLICKMLLEKPDSWLLEKTAGKTYDNAYMLRGIIQHDAYHLGQINLIQSQLKSKNRY